MIEDTLPRFVMGHPLLKNLQTSVDWAFFDESTFNQIEPHLQNYIKNNSVVPTQVAPEHVDMYAGDFYAYIKRFHPNVPYELYWLSARLSGMNGPIDFDKRHTTVYLATDVNLLNKVMLSESVVNASGI